MLGSTSRNLSSAETLWNSAAPGDSLTPGSTQGHASLSGATAPSETSPVELLPSGTISILSPN